MHLLLFGRKSFTRPIPARIKNPALGNRRILPPENVPPKLFRPRFGAPDNGEGTYKNPIIFADYSDPDVIRVGDDFYLTASSFSCFPGLPVLHSKDLVNWTIIGHAINKHPVVE